MSEHSSVKVKDKVKDIDIESGDGIMLNFQGNKQGPTSAAQAEDPNQLLENIGEVGSNIENDNAGQNRAHDEESEPVALKQPYIIPS